MSLRLKRHWFREGAVRGAPACASVVAAAVWKASVHGVKTLRAARFSVDAGAPFIAILDELLTFLVAVADRIAYRHDPGEWREVFTVALATRVGEIYGENLEGLVGPASDGGHRQRFNALLNERMDELAALPYEAEGPNAGFLRQLGYRIAAVLGDEADRRWALDQVMSVEGPEAVEAIESVMRGVLGIDPKPLRRASAGGE